MMNDLTRKRLLEVWLNYGTEHFVRNTRAVRSRYPDLEEAFALAQSGKKTAFAFLPEKTVERLTQAATDGFMQRYLDQMEQANISFALPEDEQYPELLKNIFDPPSVLYYRGKLVGAPLLPIAIVGSRSATEYGKEVARLFAGSFVRAGAVVVSGMASGVDTMAAYGALECSEAEYPTVAVLGCGVDVVYPPENRALYERIIERGAVVSEFLPASEPRREHFPIRNRIISGMSRGVLNVEAGARSGTSITVNAALEQGREVFAVPGRITDTKSIGTNRMIQSGEAKLVVCPNDVLNEFDCRTDTVETIGTPDQNVIENLPQEQQAIIECLGEGEKSFDELCELLPFSAGMLNSYLTALQFSGIMKQLPGRIYVLCAAIRRHGE